MICTTPECETPTQTYLCTQCVSDLQAWIDRVPEMREELFTTMARLDCVTPRNSEGGGGGGSAGSSVPLDEKAMDMRYALKFWQGHDAATLANDPLAGGFMADLKHLLARAERIIDLPAEIRVITTCPCGGSVTSKEPQPTPADDNPDPEDIGTCQTCGDIRGVTRKQTTERVKKAAPAMITRRLIPWLRENARITVTREDINNWQRRGHLTPVTRDPSPSYYPTDVIDVYQQKGRA